MRFSFATAGEIRFGSGILAESGECLATLGRSAFVLHGGNAERAAPLLRVLDAQGVAHQGFGIPSEPTVAMVQEAAAAARQSGADFVIGIGGGSVLDAAKAVAAFVTNTGDPCEFLEVVGQGRPLRSRPLPCAAIPTTAGAGAEVTRNSVLKTEGVKVSLRSPMLLPALVLVDPELTLSMPPEITAATGIDALTQLMEAYVSRKATPLTDALCLEGLVRGARSLRRAWHDGTDIAAREEMCLASLFSGLALANGGLGAVHGLAAPLGGVLDAPHGMVCAALLPAVMRANIAALRQRDPGGVGLRRYQELAGVLGGDVAAEADEGVAWSAALCRELRTPGLGALGLKDADIPLIVERGVRASSMRGNPVELTPGELTRVLRDSL